MEDLVDRAWIRRIVTRVRGNDKSSPIWVFVIYLLSLLILPISASLLQTEQWGVDTSALHNFVRRTQMNLHPRPFRSSWVEHDFWINETTSTETEECWSSQAHVFAVAVLTCCPWDQYFHTIWSLCSRTTDVFLLSLEPGIFRLVKKRKYMRLFSLVLAISCFSILVTFSFDGSKNIAFNLVKDNMQRWLDNSVVQVGPIEKNLSTFWEEIKHPYTNGHQPPFSLREEYRYKMEDVVFNCHFITVAYHNATPIPGAFRWKKDGKFINISDTVYTNTSVRPKGLRPLASGLQEYIVDSNLTILLIGSADFASYTCTKDGIAFVKFHSKTQQQQHFTNKKSHSERTLKPDKKCGCRPSVPQGEERYAREVEMSEICIKEFKLLESVSRGEILPVDINPGGILIDQFRYITSAPDEDIEIDITDHSNNLLNQRSECCSIFIKIFWIFFRHGMFTSLPFSRLIHHPEDGRFTITMWTCICQDSFGIKQFTFKRNYFNGTSKTREVIEIEYPVQILLRPTSNSSGPLSGCLPFCSSHRESSNRFCNHLHDFLENSAFTVYTHDICLCLVLVLFFYVAKHLIFWLKCVVLLPVRSALVTLDDPVCEHVVKQDEPASCSETRTDFTDDTVAAKGMYDVFLSYNEEEERDLQVATFLKQKLLSWGMQVYDSSHDPIPGRFALTQIGEAVERSVRYVVVMSPAYVNAEDKVFEFSVLTDWILRRNPRLCEYHLLLADVSAHSCPLPVDLQRLEQCRMSIDCEDGTPPNKRTTRRFQQWLGFGDACMVERLAQIFLVAKIFLIFVVFIILLYLASFSSLFPTDSGDFDLLST